MSQKSYFVNRRRQKREACQNGLTFNVDVLLRGTNSVKTHSMSNKFVERQEGNSLSKSTEEGGGYNHRASELWAYINVLRNPINDGRGTSAEDRKQQAMTAARRPILRRDDTRETTEAIVRELCKIMADTWDVRNGGVSDGGEERWSRISLDMDDIDKTFRPGKLERAIILPIRRARLDIRDAYHRRFRNY